MLRQIEGEEMAKYEFLKRTKPETSQYDLRKTFDFRYGEKSREFTRQIYQLKRILDRRTKNKNDNFVYKQDTDVIEFLSRQKDLSLI